MSFLIDWQGKVDENVNLNPLAQKVWKELEELACGRTPFQLVHFVVGAHGTLEEGAGPAMRLAALTELELAMRQVTRDRIGIERIDRKIKRLKEDSENEDADLDIAELMLDLQTMAFRVKKKLREIIVLEKILEKLPEYTWQEAQLLEPKRWAHRLMRQSEEYNSALNRGLPQGELMSLRQAMNEELISGVGKITTKELLDRELFLKERRSKCVPEQAFLPLYDEQD